MTVVNLILASGQGSRLYPVSTEDKPKQFLKLASDKMMIEDAIDRFTPYVDATYIVTLRKYERFVEGLKDVKVVYEDERKESATSVIRALEQIEKDFPDDVIIIQTPSDHFVKEGYFFSKAMYDALVYAEDDKIAMVGVKPKRTDNTLGYIKNNAEMFEKPSQKIAEKLIKSGFKWNTAIYAYSLKSMLFYFSLANDLTGVTFENAIIKKTNGLRRVVDGKFTWLDIGTRESLEYFEEEVWKGLKKL